MIFVYKLSFNVNLLPCVVGIIFFDVSMFLLNCKINSIGLCDHLCEGPSTIFKGW